MYLPNRGYLLLRERLSVRREVETNGKLSEREDAVDVEHGPADEHSHGGDGHPSQQLRHGRTNRTNKRTIKAILPGIVSSILSLSRIEVLLQTGGGVAIALSLLASEGHPALADL